MLKDVKDNKEGSPDKTILYDKISFNDKKS